MESKSCLALLAGAYSNAAEAAYSCSSSVDTAENSSKLFTARSSNGQESGQVDHRILQGRIHIAMTTGLTRKKRNFCLIKLMHFLIFFFFWIFTAPGAHSELNVEKRMQTLFYGCRWFL